MNNVKELKAAVRNALSAMENATAETFAEAKRNYEMAQAKLQDALSEQQAEQLERAAKQNAPKMSRNDQWKQIIADSKAGQSKTYVLRSITSAPLSSGAANNMESAGLPTTIEDLIHPLELATIYDKVGIKIQTGVAGDIIWPVVGSTVVATVAGETVNLSDSNIDFSKITAVPQRVGLSVKVSNQAINNAAFDLNGFVTSEIVKATARLLNQAVVGTTAKGSLVGPFAGTSSARGTVTFASTYPTYAELLQMKGVVAATGADTTNFAYVMNPVTYATLEATPITTGDSRMIIEGGKIAGYPVFQTDAANIANGAVNAGSFAYAALNQHGDVRLTVDPYSLAAADCVVFNINADWSLTTLKAEAFCLGSN